MTMLVHHCLDSRLQDLSQIASEVILNSPVRVVTKRHLINRSESDQRHKRVKQICEHSRNQHTRLVLYASHESLITVKRLQKRILVSLLHFQSLPCLTNFICARHLESNRLSRSQDFFCASANGLEDSVPILQHRVAIERIIVVVALHAKHQLVYRLALLFVSF